MNITHPLITIFCQMDDFCNELDQHLQHHLLPGTTSGSRGPSCSLAVSEIMLILVMFQRMKFRHFKAFYQGFLSSYWRPFCKANLTA